MPTSAPGDDTPLDRLADNEMAALLRWGPWLMSGADGLLNLAQEIDALGIAFGGNPVSRLDRLAILFQGMAEDLAAAAESMRAVADDRRRRVREQRMRDAWGSN